MIHATRFVAGVALKNIGAGLVTVTLTQVEGGSRARAAARFMVDVQHASMGEGERVRFIDARGYPEALQLGQVVQWLSKHMSGGAVSVRINVTDAARLPAPWTPSRINAMAAKFAAVDPDALRDDAAAKVATVTSWADSGRRAAVLDAAARMGECAAFVEWVRGERAEWPGAGDGVIEPPPPPPAPAPEPPAPAPEPPAPPPPPPPPAAPEWAPTEGGAGARVAPLHVLTGEAPEQVQETVVPEAATHVLAVSMQDDQGASFWWVDKPGGSQRLLYCSDAQAVNELQTTPSLFESLERAARPPVEDGQGRTVRYAVIRLSDGAIIYRTNKTGGVFTDAQASGAVKYMALAEDGSIMGLADSPAGAGAAVRAYFGWLMPMGTAYYPAPGDVLRWVECDLVADTETPRLLTYAGRAVVGLAGEALPVRPLVSVNSSAPGAARQATHAMMVPGTINGARVYYLEDLLACDAPSDADAIQWAQHDANMWGRPYDALRRVLVRMSDGAALGERDNSDGNGNWLWGATAAGAAGRMVWAPATESMPAQFLGTERAGDASGVADLVRTYWAVQPGEEFAYYTTPMGGGTSTPATVIGAATAPAITPV